ncbi:Signal recognition particle, subunit Srp19 [Pseudoloma neurophilia]|uniref:Signal recognition particle, subunit Srp19 n=1 Tax=Pseudoloma neurophilia TaxID=146866 RepID=A0A0R0M1A0_9MICR|nr:Signal recognition particle, subunit Srp19 [Pseudoloma neurophilia]
MTKTFTLYPCHFDSTLTKKQGRKYSTKKCVKKPTCEEMEEASLKLQIDTEVQKNKRHPKDQDVSGRLVFSKSIDRYIVVAALKQEITAERIAKKERALQKISDSHTKKEVPVVNQETGEKTVKVLVSKRKKNKEEKKKQKILGK